MKRLKIGDETKEVTAISCTGYLYVEAVDNGKGSDYKCDACGINYH